MRMLLPVSVWALDFPQLLLRNWGFGAHSCAEEPFVAAQEVRRKKAPLLLQKEPSLL